MPTSTAWVVYCETHGHYLKHTSPGGTTWRDRDDAKLYATKPAAAAAAKSATWVDHRPIVWAVPVPTAELI